MPTLALFYFGQFTQIILAVRVKKHVPIRAQIPAFGYTCSRKLLMLWHDKYMLRKKKSQYKKMKMYKNCTHIAIFFNLFPLIYYDMGKKVQKVRLARVVGIKKKDSTAVASS